MKCGRTAHTIRTHTKRTNREERVAALSVELRAIGACGSASTSQRPRKTSQAVSRQRSIAREFANGDVESMQRFARERDRKAAKRDELDQKWLTALRLGAARGTHPFKGEASSAGLAPEDVLVYVERCNGRRSRPHRNGEYRCPEPKCS